MTRLPILVLLLTAAPLAAQSTHYVGDSVRVREWRGGSWLEGRLLAQSLDSITVQSRLREHRFALERLERVDRWARTDPLPLIAYGTVAGGALWFLGSGQLWGKDRGPITGSSGGDAALGAGVGMLAGVVAYLLTPGQWKRLWRGG